MRTRSEFAEHVIASFDVNPNGFFKFDKFGEQVEYQGQVYTYHMNGLAKIVYKSEDGKTVLKFPHSKEHDDIDFLHILCEADAWEGATEEERQYLAETHYVPELNCIIQEFVDVVDNKGNLAAVNGRELGITKDGRTVIFDCDPLCDNFDKPWGGYYYDYARRIIESHLAADNQK